MILPRELLDKTVTIQRQAPGAGTATLSTVATGIRCSSYDGSGWSPGADGGVFNNQGSVYVGDMTGSQIPGGLRPGDFLTLAGVEPGSGSKFVVRGVKAYQNYRVFGAGVVYVANCEPVPTGNLPL